MVLKKRGSRSMRAKASALTLRVPLGDTDIPNIFSTSLSCIPVLLLVYRARVQKV
jgi:hypothetical protein